ncbi:MAG: DUF4129 domain-containing protein [Flavitalea sp.]
MRLKMVFLFMLSSFTGVAQNLRTVPVKVVDSIKQSKDYAYANDPTYWAKKNSNEESGFWEFIFRVLASDGFKWTMYLAFTALFFFIIYRILKVQGVFDRRNKKLKDDQVEHELTDISADSLEEKIRENYNLGNFRDAIRFHYLHLLKLLSLKEMIFLKSTATNHDYLLQMSTSDLKPDFSLLTNIYDHVWYGEAKVNADQYSRIDQYFIRIKERLRY